MSWIDAQLSLREMERLIAMACDGDLPEERTILDETSLTVENAIELRHRIDSFGNV